MAERQLPKLNVAGSIPVSAPVIQQLKAKVIRSSHGAIIFTALPGFCLRQSEGHISAGDR